ncbi:MAG TPA: phospholipase D-like domain-containing protein [Solimonas sp.]|nr:phospholipase D-like domain-containing protein [Solimonas sp.]
MSWMLVWWPLALALGLYAAGHALLHKRDPRSAWGWMGLSLMLPLAGPLIYFLMGVNRVNTRAHRMRPPRRALGRGVGLDHRSDARHHREHQRPVVPAGFRQVARTVDVITRRPLLAGNTLQPLHNGEEAFPRMLAAIDAAQESVLLASYIFDVDVIGERFIAALAKARVRGVRVCVLVDGYAELSLRRRRASRRLTAEGVEVLRFHPPTLLPPSLHLNLRNHRKLLIVDGQLGYTGGMNISHRHMALDPQNPVPETDLHFELRGPIVQQLAEAFADDWRYSGGNACPCPPEPTEAAIEGAACRVITDGPNEDLGQLTLVLMSAFASARKRIRIMTPYFLPPRELVAALETAVMRGVKVEIVLPSRSDLEKVRRAMRHTLGELVLRGLRIYYQPPPFAHGKLLMIDGEYAQIGSANMDPRSLRLNFELVVEVYDAGFALQLNQHFEAVRKRSHQVRQQELRRQPLRTRLVDAFWWLFSPYL